MRFQRIFIPIGVFIFIFLVFRFYKSTRPSEPPPKTKEELEREKVLFNLNARVNLLQTQLFEKITLPKYQTIVDSKSVSLFGELTDDEKNPSAPFRINIISPSLPRIKKGTDVGGEKGYDYLKQTFTSLKNSFGSMNIDFHHYAYSRSEMIPDQDLIEEERFHFIHLPTVKLEEKDRPIKIPGYLRYDVVLQQNLDWVTMMKEFKKVCRPGEVFLYLEDDFNVCPHADTHIISMYYWALKHRSSWKSIRLTFGFSGLLMKCDDIDEYVQHIWNCCLSPKQSIYPVDYALGMYWTQYHWETGKQVHHTFRYNLFDHIGGVSTVQNDGDKKYNPQCFDGMGHYFNFHYEKFNTFDCEKSLVSPCHEASIQTELEYHGSETIRSRSILLGLDKKLLESKIKLSVLKKKVEDEDCETICKINGLRCIESLYPFVNSCEVMRSNFNCLFNVCMSQVWSVWKWSAPFYNSDGQCVMLDEPTYQCSAKYTSAGPVEKICPCIAY